MHPSRVKRTPPGPPPVPHPPLPALRAAASARSRRNTESSGRRPRRRCPGSAAESEKETAAACGQAPLPATRAAAAPRLTPDIGLQGRHAAAHGRRAQRLQAARPLRRHRVPRHRHLGRDEPRLPTSTAIVGGWGGRSGSHLEKVAKGFPFLTLGPGRPA